MHKLKTHSLPLCWSGNLLLLCDLMAPVQADGYTSCRHRDLRLPRCYSLFLQDRALRSAAAPHGGLLSQRLRGLTDFPSHF